MTDGNDLTAAEFVSLREIAKSFCGASVPAEHVTRLLELRLAYKLLGDLRVTAAGRTRVDIGH